MSAKPLTDAERWTVVEAIAIGCESAAALAMYRNKCRCLGCRMEAAASIADALGVSVATYCDMPEADVVEKLRT